MTYSGGGSGQYGDHLVARDPVPLQFGKSDRALVACAIAFLGGSWCHGLEHGVTIFAQVHDRGLEQRFRRAVSGHLRNLRSD
eukprot:5191645-Amphidinium_carterae.1